MNFLPPLCRGCLVAALTLGGTAVATAQTTQRATTDSTAARRVAAAPTPEPSLWDGSGFPKEERPERGLLADFEAGANSPSAATATGHRQSGGGGEQQGGGGGGMAGAGGRSGEPPPDAAAGQPGGGGELQIAAAQQGAGTDPAGASGGGPPPPDSTPLEKPTAVSLGDPAAQIAIAARQDPRNAPIGAAPAQQGPSEQRMSVEAARGQQTPNRSRGSERGMDMPSDL